MPAARCFKKSKSAPLRTRNAQKFGVRHALVRLLRKDKEDGIQQPGSEVEHMVVDNARKQDGEDADARDRLGGRRPAEKEQHGVRTVDEVSKEGKNTAHGEQLKKGIVHKSGDEIIFQNGVPVRVHAALRELDAGDIIPPDAEEGMLLEHAPRLFIEVEAPGVPAAPIDDRIHDGHDRIPVADQNNNPAQQQHGVDEEVPKPFFSTGFDERHENAADIDARPCEHGAAALRQDDAQEIHGREQRIQPAVLPFDGKIDGRGHTERHHGADAVPDPPARIETVTAAAAVQGGRAGVGVHAQHLRKQPDAEDGHKQGRIVLRHLLPVHAEIEKEVKETQRGDLDKAEEHRTRIVIGRKRAAQQVGDAKEHIPRRQLGHAALFAFADLGEKARQKDDDGKPDVEKERVLRVLLCKQPRNGEFSGVVLRRKQHVAAGSHGHDAEQILAQQHAHRPQHKIGGNDVQLQ